MTRLKWGDVGSRIYESGVDRGVLYLDGQPGVVWNGLTNIEENSSGGDPKPFYQDGIKYVNGSAAVEFAATITAFTYPDEFGHCDGSYQARPGLFVTSQKRQSFGLTYRTKIANDLSSDLGYKIHIVYNALSSPSQRSNKSISDSVDLSDFSWNITTRPPVMSGYRPTAHIVIDSRKTDPSILELVENSLYGTDEDSPTLPSFGELVDLFDTISTLVIVDNGDGTWTATAPFDVIQMLDSETFAITTSSAEFIDDDTYTISSE